MDISRISAGKLRQLIQRRVDRLPQGDQKKVIRNIHNAIFAQFLDGIAVLKGGGALCLRYPVEQGRSSRDLDATIKSDIETFEKDLNHRLSQGLNGFTGEIKANPRNHETDGTKAGMHPYIVSIKYNNQPFTKIEFEAAPDHSGFLDHAEPALNEQTYRILDEIGIPVRAPKMITPMDQLADKLHAVSRPGAARGRDLADIMRGFCCFRGLGCGLG